MLSGSSSESANEARCPPASDPCSTSPSAPALAAIRASRGLVLGHVSPEAAAGGPIAAVQDGDMISIDLESYSVSIEVEESILSERLANLPAWTPRVNGGYLHRYAEMVTSASTGAVFTESIVAD